MLSTVFWRAFGAILDSLSNQFLVSFWVGFVGTFVWLLCRCCLWVHGVFFSVCGFLGRFRMSFLTRFWLTFGALFNQFLHKFLANFWVSLWSTFGAIFQQFLDHFLPSLWSSFLPTFVRLLCCRCLWSQAVFLVFLGFLGWFRVDFLMSFWSTFGSVLTQLLKHFWDAFWTSFRRSFGAFFGQLFERFFLAIFGSAFDHPSGQFASAFVSSLSLGSRRFASVFEVFRRFRMTF